jgi:hypothetical protein
MRCNFVRFVAVALLVTLAPPYLCAADPVKPGAPDKSKTIPNSFQAWMVTGPHAGRYHSPVCDHGLNPVVLVFIREVEGADKPLFDFLKKLDELAAKHADVKLGVCAIFLNDGGLREALSKSGEDYTQKFAKTTVVKQDLERQLRALAQEKGLEKVAIALDTTAGPPGYQIDDQSQITVVFYDQQNVLARETFAKDKLTDADVKKTLGGVQKKVTALEARLRQRRQQ